MRHLLLVTALALAPVGAQAVTYDAVAAFSTSNGNPNGVWSYGYGTPGSSFTLLPTAGSFDGTPTWSLNTIPLVGNSHTGGTVAVPAGDLWLHPGDSNDQAAILRFTAPTSGTYSLAGFFERADNANGGGDGVGVTIYSNNAVLVARSLLATTYLTRSAFNTGTVLAAGDTLSFVVDRNGEYTYDSTGLQVTINSAAPASVPEPFSMALLGGGVVGALALRRRRQG